MKHISVESVLKRFKEDEHRDDSLARYLGVKSEDFCLVAEKMTQKLKELGVLDERGKEARPFTSKVIGAFGINYFALNQEIDSKIKRDWGTITEKLTHGKGFKGMPRSEMEDVVKDPISAAQGMLKHNPRDKIVWVAKVLSRQGMKEATMETWFLTSFFFGKLARAKIMKLLGKGMGIFKHLSGA